MGDSYSWQFQFVYLLSEEEIRTLQRHLALYDLFPRYTLTTSNRIMEF